MKDLARVGAFVGLGLVILAAAGYWILSDDGGGLDAGTSPGSDPAVLAATEPAGLSPAAMEAGADTTAAAKRRLEAAGIDPAAADLAEEEAGKPDPQGRDDVGFRGRVIDEFGNPVAGVKVVARRGGGRFLFWSGPRPDEGVVTDAEGRFELRGLRPRASYAVLADHPDYQPEARPKLVTGEAILALEDLVLEIGATVSGRVIGPDGAAVAGAKVWGSRSRNGSFEFFIDGIDEEGGLGAFLPTRRRSTETDDEGAFRLSGLPAGKLSLWASSKGYSKARSDPFELTKGQVISGLVLALKPGSTIAGQVVDSAGMPVAEASVRVDSFGRLRDDGKDKAKDAVHTDARGLFQVEGVSDGRHSLTVEADGFSTYHKWNVMAGSEDLAIVLSRSSTIKGRVVRAGDGAPIKGFRVWASGGHSYGSGRSDTNQDKDGEDNDSFELTGLRAGSYRVAVESEGYGRSYSDPIELTEGQTVDDLVIALHPGAVLSGQVVAQADGQPVEGAKVRLRKQVRDVEPAQSGALRVQSTEIDMEDYPQPFDMSASGFNRSVDTDKNGRFEIIGVPEGEYTFSVRSGGHAAYGPETLHLAAGERREDFAVALLQGGIVTGTVRDLEGQPIPGETINVRGPLPEGKTTQTGKTGPDGVYRIEHLAAGDWEISRGGHRSSPFIFDESMVLLGSHGGQSAENTAEHVLIEEGKVTQRDFSDATLGMVSGRVLAAGGPVAGARVRLLSAASRGFFGPGAPGATSDEQGRYQIERIKPGDYRLQVGVDRAPIPYEEKITIGQGTQSLDLHLPGGRITGRVVAEYDGSPVEGARISLRTVDRSGEDTAEVQTLSYQIAVAGDDLDGGMMTFTGMSHGTGAILTDSNGEYVLDYVPAGSYEITLNHSGFVLAEKVAVELADGQVKSAVNVKARAAVQITGKVTSSVTGKPLGMLVVELCTEEGSQNATFVQDDGLYRFDGLKPGVYTLVANAEGYQKFERQVVAETGGELEVPIVLSPR